MFVHVHAQLSDVRLHLCTYDALKVCKRHFPELWFFPEPLLPLVAQFTVWLDLMVFVPFAALFHALFPLCAFPLLFQLFGFALQPLTVFVREFATVSVTAGFP